MQYSIIIPTYNSAKYIEKCLSTLIPQITKGIEVIFVDDNSSDDTINIIKIYSKDKSNITILKNDKNMGPSYSRNRGLDIDKGKYILFVDSDDVLYNKFLDNAKKYCDRQYEFVLNSRKNPC